MAEYSTNIDACSCTHGTALMIALRNRRRYVAPLLIEKGTDVNFTPVLAPATKTSRDFKQLYSTSCDYRTPLEVAVYRGRALQLKLLFEHGVATEKLGALKLADELCRFTRKENSELGPVLAETGDLRSRGKEPSEYPSIMRMLAKSDSRHKQFFDQNDEEPIIMEVITRMMEELNSSSSPHLSQIRPLVSCAAPLIRQTPMIESIGEGFDAYELMLDGVVSIITSTLRFGCW